MREARKKYQKRNTEANKENLYNTKDEFDTARKKECQDFLIQRTIKLNTVQSLRFWKEFNSIFKKKTQQNIDPLFNNKGDFLTDINDMEELMFATFFEGHHLQDGNFDDYFYNETNRIYNEIINNQQPSDQLDCAEEINAEITIAEIKAAIKSYKSSGKSSDKEDVNPIMFKHLKKNAIDIICKLANLCLKEGKWIWDRAEVIFLKKSGKDTYSKPGSYRPISISSYIGKLLEKILAKRIAYYLSLIGIHDPTQEGFTPKRNTIRYLNRMSLQIKYELLDKNTVIGLFIDFEKAFDSVWKQGLIVKMSRLNMKGKILRLIDDFLQNRKVMLDVNGEVGKIRNTSTYGLPQGSALSPVLFKIYLLDILEEFRNDDTISIFKFADDGSVIISKRTSADCVDSLKQVMESLKVWSSQWRMVINCQKNKTEYVCFGTAEKTANIPETVKLGNKEINRVTETKVLGVMIDEKLNYQTHSEMVLNRLLGKWAMICKYSNNQWGFSQKIIAQVTKSLILSILHYAGSIWITNKNITEIESLWYRIVKAATGAVFNVRKCIAEVIIGLPPLTIQNKINTVKHYMKLNINPDPEDKVRELIRTCYINQQTKKIPVELSSSLKEVFKFLAWKSEICPQHFTENDKSIVSNNRIDKFLNLTTKSCSYTKNQINRYTEKIWSNTLRNEFNMNGFHHIPIPSCSNIPIPRNTSRHDEVVLMSLMYTNNLFHSNLYRHTYLVESPLCRRCKEKEETPYHVILECSEKSYEARKILLQVLNREELMIEDCTTLLNGSRHAPFIKICLDILAQDDYSVQVNL